MKDRVQASCQNACECLSFWQSSYFLLWNNIYLKPSVFTTLSCQQIRADRPSCSVYKGFALIGGGSECLAHSGISQLILPSCPYISPNRACSQQGNRGYDAFDYYVQSPQRKWALDFSLSLAMAIRKQQDPKGSFAFLLSAIVVVVEQPNDEKRRPSGQKWATGIHQGTRG